MVINNLGYIFECRQDVNGSLGVMENFRVMFKNDEQRVSLTFGIDDYKQFIKCHQLATFSLEDLKKKVNDTVCRYIKEIF